MFKSRFEDSGYFSAKSVQTSTSNTHPTSTHTYSSVANRSTMYGIQIKGFHARKRRGELLPHTSFGKEVWKVEHLGGSYHHRVISNGDYWDIANWVGYAGFPAPYQIDQHLAGANLDPTGNPPRIFPDYLLQKQAAKIAQAGFDALTSAAELKKTGNMFSKVVDRAGKLALNTSPKRMYQLWLEGRYGWRILALEIKDLFEVCAEFDSKRRIWAERSGLSFKEESFEIVGHGHNGKLNFQLSKHSIDNYHLRGSVAARISPSKFGANPLATAWELVPYSFVLDHVLDIGQFLAVQQFYANADSWTASRGFLCESEHRFVCEMTTPRNGFTGHANAQWLYTGHREKRDPTGIPSYPLMPNRVLLPELATDLVALQRVRSRLR